MAQILYGALGGSNATSSLFTIDPVTGTAVSVGGSIPYALTGLAFDPTDGTLYGATSNNSGSNPRYLITIDETTGFATAVIGQFSAAAFHSFTDIAFDSTGQLYGQAAFSVSGTNHAVCTIDKTNATFAKLTSTINLGNNFIVVDSGDVGYEMSGGHLYSVDLATGVTVDLGANSLNYNSNAGTIDENDLIWTCGNDGIIRTINIGTRVVTVGPTTTANIDAIAWGPSVTPPAPPSTRFFQGYPWRFVFTDLDSTVTTWASGLLTSRNITLALGEPTTIEAAVWPDDIRVNEIWTDGYPRLAQSKRLVYCFRREGTGVTPHGDPNAPWRIRAAGILMSPEDQGDADSVLTHFTAYDARKYLEARPCVNALGALPGANGLSWFATDGSTIVAELLKWTIDSAFGGSTFIDAGVAYSGTAFWTGVIESTEQLNFNVEQGQSVGDAWSELEATGTLDIVLTPIYDPINRPGYTHELSVRALAGSEQRTAVFGWDVMNRALKGIDRVHDGTPGSFFNIVEYFTSAGVPIGPLTNPASIADFGRYWAQQFFPAQSDASGVGSAVYRFAALALELAKQGKRTLTLQPTPERAPIPLTDYTTGDRVYVYASDRLRVTSAGAQRVQSIPINIDDDGIEHVDSLLVSPDWMVPGT